jgi:hypothetical protein
VDETAAALLVKPTTFTISTVDGGIVCAARLSLLHSPLWGEGRYRAVVGIMSAGGTALAIVCVRGGYKSFSFEDVRRATQGCYQCIALYERDC